MTPNPTATTDTAATTMTYDDALRVFLATKGSFGGGLSNHGPMASEALVHMGADRWIGPFVESYRRRLDEREPPPTQPDDPHELIGTRLPGLVGAAAAEAGHGLLRVAHAVRAIERADAVPAVRVAELRAALGYWRAGGPGLPSPEAIDGDLSPDEWAGALGDLISFDPLPGLLTGTLDLAARQPGFTATVASLAPRSDAGDTLDDLALLAVAGYLRNDDFLSRFALLHGVTVSTMARVLLPHLVRHDERRLVAAVAGFVAAAIIGFDRPEGTEAAPPAPADDPADRAGATLDDHTIKFTDACIGLASRTGRELPLRAADLQIALTS